MQYRYGPRLSLALIAATAAIGLVILWLAPTGAQVPVHFSGRWAPDRFVPPAHGLMVWMGLLLGLWLTFSILRYWFRDHIGFQASLPVYDLAWITLTGGQCVLAVGSMEYALGRTMTLMSLNSVTTGLFFILIGNGLGKIRPNPVLGIRTRWTKASVPVWDRTHRTCGPLFILTGLFVMASGFGLVGRAGHLIILGGSLLALATVCYGLSWFYWRQEQIRG